MSQQELLKTVVAVLERLGIEYMLTGSVASSLQGEPRSTHGIDIVAVIRQEDGGGLVSSFPAPSYYLDESAMRDAVSQKSMFNLIHVDEGDKVDFWALTDEPFDRSRFSRRYVESISGMNLRVSSPEDTILAKLRWADLSGGSEKLFTDALRVYEVQYGSLDLEYLETWATHLNVQHLWERLRNEAEPIPEI